MSEKQLNQRARLTVLTPLIIILTMLLFCTSCSSNKCIYKKDWKKSNESRR